MVRVWCVGTDESENAVGQFLSWCENNSMHSNPKKCKELTFQRKGYTKELELVHNIPQCRKMVVLGITLQDNNRFNTHVSEKLIKANKVCTLSEHLKQKVTVTLN